MVPDKVKNSFADLKPKIRDVMDNMLDCDIVVGSNFSRAITFTSN